MSDKLPVDDFKWIEKKSRFTLKFIQSLNDDSNKGYIFKVDVSYSSYLQKIHSDIFFLSERIKIG